MAKPGPGWAQEAEARLQALEQVVLSTLDPVQQEKYQRQVEENHRQLLKPDRPFARPD